MNKNSPMCPSPLAVIGLVPMVYVADVERALASYALLGFVAGDRVRMEVGGTPVTQWASAACIGTGADGKGKAAVFFARADPVPVPEQQGVALYMCCDDVAGVGLVNRQ